MCLPHILLQDPNVFVRKGSLTTPAEILSGRLEERKQLQLVGLPGHKSPSIRGSVTWNLNMFLGGLFLNATLWDGFTTIMVLNHVLQMFW